jgi:hypothetical protein
MRQLSSNWTSFFKIPFPMLWVGCLGYVALGPFLHTPAKVGHSETDWVNLGLFAVASIFVLRFAAGIKYVALSGNELLIGNYGKTIRVPLKDIEHVWGGRRLGRWFTSALIRFQTRVPTEFGSEISFMPTWTFSFGQHPLVEELTDLVREAKGLES